MSLRGKRHITLSDIEIELSLKGFSQVAGVDEVGRGPLAGPIVASAVIWDNSVEPGGIVDSKLLSPVRREELFSYIVTNAVDISVAWATPAEIDSENILKATFLAMRRAIDSLSIRPEFVLIDGNRTIPLIDIPQKAVINGDNIVLSISAASIVAKVLRDRLMLFFDSIFPKYGFSHNKGYPTKFHKDAIMKYGLCPIHRKSFHV